MHYSPPVLRPAAAPAAMLESAGLLEDALREYSELEAVYLEVLQSGQQTPRQPFGGKPPGEDEAEGLWAGWARTRAAAADPAPPPEFAMRQALFASQARLLLKLHRHAEVRGGVGRCCCCCCPKGSDFSMP